MGLIERIKSALGLETSASSPSRPGRTTERPTPTDESDAGGEATSVGDASEADDEPTTTAEESTGPATDEPTDQGPIESSPSDDEVDVTVEHDPDAASDEAVEPSTETEDAVKGTETAADEPSADLEDIKGIGPTYAERLREAGIEDVAALADADAASLSERADVPESRVQNWIDRAGTY